MARPACGLPRTSMDSGPSGGPVGRPRSSPLTRRRRPAPGSLGTATCPMQSDPGGRRPPTSARRQGRRLPSPQFTDSNRRWEEAGRGEGRPGARLPQRGSRGHGRACADSKGRSRDEKRDQVSPSSTSGRGRLGAGLCWPGQRPSPSNVSWWPRWKAPGRCGRAGWLPTALGGWSRVLRASDKHGS